MRHHNLQVTGSVVVNGLGLATTADLNTYTASADAKISTLQAFTSSVGTTNTFTASTNSRLDSIETITASNVARLNSLEIKTGSLATTGSNTFYGQQVFSGSLYVQDNLIVQGSSSLQNITASAVSIGTNIVYLNTDTPAVRFAGLTVQDSGSSAGVTGSMLWDSLCNRWIYSNPSTIGYSGGMLLSGPRTNTLGSESPLTCNYIAKSGGGDHLYDSCIIDNGNSICFNTPTGSFSGKIGIGASNPRWQLEICNDTASTGAGTYPAISINNPNISGYSGLYFYKGLEQLGGIEYSNTACSILMNAICTLSLQTQNVDRLTIHDGIVKINLNKACNIGGGVLNLNGDLRFGGVGGQNYCIVNYQGGCLQLGTNNSPYLTIGLNGSTTLSCQLYLDGCNRDTVFVKSNNVCYSRLFYTGNNAIVFHNGGAGGQWGLNNYEDTAGLFRVYNSGQSCWWGAKAVCGNIGIFSTSAKFFQVTNNCKSADSVLDIYNTASDGFGASIQAGANNNNYALTVSNFASTPLLHVAGNGQIGIGCGTPNAKLTINSGNCINSVNIYGSNSAYISQLGWYDSTNVNPASDGIGGQRVALIEIGTVAGTGTGCRGANMGLYTHEANGTLKLPLLLTHTGHVCMQGNLYTTCTLFAPGTPIQVVTGTAITTSGPSGNNASLGPSAGGATPGYNCGCLITSVSFTPKSASSKILIQTNNVSMWETANVSDHFYLWASNDSAGTVLAKSGGYILNLGQCTGIGAQGAIVNLNGAANSWGTSANTISFRIGTSGGPGNYYQWNPYYAAGGFNSDTVGYFTYTIMEIAQ